MVWHGVVWYDVVYTTSTWYGMAWYSMALAIELSYCDWVVKEIKTAVNNNYFKTCKWSYRKTVMVIF